MTSPAERFSFLACATIMMLCLCKAGIPPPTGLSYTWLDQYTVKVSWQEPSGLPEGDIKYKYRLDAPDSPVKGESSNSFRVTLLTEETGSGNWTYLFWTVDENNTTLSESIKVPITIKTPKPRAEVKDIRCFVTYPNGKMNCSWVAGSQPLNFSYRICGRSDEHIMNLSKCDRPYGDTTRRKGCNLKLTVYDDICMLFESEAGLSTFKLAPMVDPPEFNIKEEGGYLELTQTPPKIPIVTWIFEICYNKCSNAEVCQEGNPVRIAYDKSCRYEFQSRIKPTKDFKQIFSERSKVVLYGTNRPTDELLTVVAIVLPVILSLCIFLSCYCFRRHSAIICPVMPDPSAIFKEMMMNGNKELKTTPGSLYTPVPEPIDSCKVDPVTESIVVQLNS